MGDDNSVKQSKDLSIRLKLPILFFTSFEVSSDYDGSSKERRDPKLSTKDQSEEREMEMKVKGKGTRRWDGGVWCEGE
jgi:hypothetical protein